MSDVLSGVDGTELPELRSDPSERSDWRDAPGMPPLTLPAIPDPRVAREAIAAALGEDPTGSVDQGPGAAPAQQSSASPSVAPPNVPQPKVPQGNIPPPNTSPSNVPSTSVPPSSVPPSNVSPTNITAPLPTPSASQAEGPPPAGAPGHRPRPIIPAPVPPAQPPRRPSGLRYRPPLAVGSRTLVQRVDFRRRRAGRQGPGLPLQTRSDGGAVVFFFIALIIFGVLAYSIIAGIVESILRLFQ